MKKLWLDFETRSHINIKDCGLDRYSHDPSTEVLMLAWAFDDETPKLWQPRLESMPAELFDTLADSSIQKCAWNYNFEKAIFRDCLSIDIPQEEWYDPSILCANMSLPIGLHRASDALTKDTAKIHIIGDERPLKLFSQLSKATKKMIKEGSPEKYYKDWNSHPEDWKTFCDYCIQDVVSERAVHYAAVAFKSPIHPTEHQAWLLDQRMNRAGVYIDQVFVQKAKEYAQFESDTILAEIKMLTNVDNPNSRTQLLPWLTERGYPYTSLDAEHVEEALKKDLHKDVREVLERKVKLGGSAYKKLQSIQDRVSADGYLRDQFVFHGAHTARWSGRGVQLQNLYKPDKAAAKRTDEFVNAIRSGTFVPDTIPTMTAVASVIRASFIASPGHKLIVGDLAQIESRGLAAVAQCQTMIDAYANGKDLYKDFMSWLLDKPIDEVDSDERARGKVVILGCGYSMGWEKFVEYAATFGIKLEEVQAKEAVYGFRKKYPEIPKLWNALNAAVINAVEFKMVVYVNHMIIDGRDTRMLKIKLPSGRALHYYAPKVTSEIGWKGKLEKSVSYTAFDMKGVQVKRLYGGLITENVIQAVARDLLLSGMFEAEKMGFKIIMTIHDEIVTEVPIDSKLTLDDLLHCMTKLPEWAEDMGFVLAAEGWEGKYYKK